MSCMCVQPHGWFERVAEQGQRPRVSHVKLPPFVVRRRGKIVSGQNQHADDHGERIELISIRMKSCYFIIIVYWKENFKFLLSTTNQRKLYVENCIGTEFL